MCPIWWHNGTGGAWGWRTETSVTTATTMLLPWLTTGTATTWDTGTISLSDTALPRWELVTPRQTSGRPAAPPPPMPEVARQALLRQERARSAQLRRTREAAEARAETLLGRFLDDAQRDSWTREGFFDLRVGDKTYRLRRGMAGNIDLLRDGTGVRHRTYCAHLPSEMPVADNVLAQLLMLREDEASFLRLANVH